MATSTVKPTVVSAGASWSTLLLDLLGAPTTAANYKFLNQWATREHGSSYPASLYANNPFFTTAGGGGTVGPLKAGTYPTIANTPGVAVYPNIETGDVATALHIGTEYPGILAALKSGNPGQYANNPQFQSDLQRWSGAGYSSVGSVAAPAQSEGPVIHATIGISSGGVTGIQSAGVLSNILKQLPFIPSTGGVVPGGVNPLPNVSNSIVDALGLPKLPANPIMRGAELAGGAVLILLGLIIIGTRTASSSPAVATAGAARTAARAVK